MSTQRNSQTISQRHRQLLRQGDDAVRERLQATAAAAAKSQAAAAVPAPAPVPATPSGPEPMPVIVTTQRDRLAAAASPADAPARARRRRWPGRVLFLFLLSGLAAGAWLYREPLTELAGERLISAVFAILSGDSADQTDPVPEQRNDPASIEPEPVEPAPSPETESEALIRPAEATATIDTEPTTDTEAAANPELVPDPAPVAAANEPQFAGEPHFELAQTLVRAQEGDAFVAVIVRREGDASAQATIVWQAFQDTARAGEDFVDLGEQLDRFAPGERSLRLPVPLVDDGLPEPAEQFSVRVGRRVAASDRVESIGTVRVVIDDNE